MHLDPLDIFGYSFLTAVLGSILIGLYSIAQPHSIQGYYLSTANTSGICVVADIDWQPDQQAYCTDNVTKALEVYQGLK